MTSRPARTRADLMAALEKAMRAVSGQGVLYSQAVAKRLAIGGTELECLDFLVDGPKTAGELAKASGLTTGAITGVVDRLERAGLARRERDADDRRKVFVRALPAVVERVAPLFDPMQRAAQGMLDGYSEDELALILDFLNRASDAAIAALSELQASEARGRGRRRPRSPSA